MPIFKSIVTFGGFTMISRLLGFVRDVVIANLLGASALADAFLVAFKLPNLFRSLFAEGAFNAAFVPMVSAKLEESGKEDALEFASKAMSLLSFVLLIFVAFVECFMPFLVIILAPGFGDISGKMEIATELSRITFPYLLFISIVSLQSGVLNSFGKFAAPAICPIILNITMIVFVFTLSNYFSGAARALSWGVAFAGLLQILWLFVNLKKANLDFDIVFKYGNLFRDKEIRTLLKRIVPGIVGAGIYQINILVDTILVSLVANGAVSWLYYANRLNQLPLGVIGAAVGVVMLPVLSRNIKSGDIEETNRSQNKAVTYAALLCFPAAVGLLVLAKPIVNVLFEHGEFGTIETYKTYIALIALSLGLPAYVLTKSLAPNFFARGDTRTPVVYSGSMLIVNLILNIILMRPFGHLGIAISTSISAWFGVILYYIGLVKRDYWYMNSIVSRNILKILFSSLVMGFVVYFLEKLVILQFGDWLLLKLNYKVVILGFLCAGGVISYIISANISGVISVKEILGLLKRKEG
jgi:putative peptidoglycan lipid II flippase